MSYQCKKIVSVDVVYVYQVFGWEKIGRNVSSIIKSGQNLSQVVSVLCKNCLQLPRSGSYRENTVTV